jgi:ParB family chromosome partitioning protein
MTDIRKKLAGKATKLAQDRPKQDDHPANNVNDCREGSYYHLDIDLILPDPEQPEKYFDPVALAELADSIRQKRLYQPVVVRKDETGRIVLVAGKRRLKAAKMAGLEKIPAVFTQGNPLEISMIENLQRENLKPIEEAEAIGRMMEQHGYTEEKLAFAIGKARHTISEAIKLGRLPETIKDECRRDDKYPWRLLVEIAGQDTPEAMMCLYNRAKQGALKRDEGIHAAGKQAETTRRVPAETAMDGNASFNAFLPGDDIETTEQHKKARLLIELQNLVKIIDELIIK